MTGPKPMILIVTLILVLAACGTPAPTATPGTVLVPEHPVMTIPLSGPLTNRNAEVSGLAWYGEHLIILPQYPRFATVIGDGSLYTLSKADILAYLDGASAGPLEASAIPLSAPGLASQIDGFEGYEAIAFVGDRVYLTIEASTGEGMRGYLVSGSIAPDLSSLTLDTTVQVEIQPQADLDNKSDESLLVTGDGLLTFYEANGAAVNPSPLAHKFDQALVPAGTIPLPSIEYRLTDVTALDSDGRFWAINYYFPEEPELLPESDPLAERYGQGPTHARSEPVERLVEFQYTESGIDLVDRPPLQLELLPDDARNWEGLVRLDDRGFLLMTDKFPETILGFVAPLYEH